MADHAESWLSHWWSPPSPATTFHLCTMHHMLPFPDGCKSAFHSPPCIPFQNRRQRADPQTNGAELAVSPPSPSSFELDELPIDSTSPPTFSSRRYPYDSLFTFTSLWLTDVLQLTMLATSSPATIHPRRSSAAAASASAASS